MGCHLDTLLKVISPLYFRNIEYRMWNKFVSFLILSLLTSTVVHAERSLETAIEQTRATFGRLATTHQTFQLQNADDCMVALQELTFVVNRCSSDFQSMFLPQTNYTSTTIEQFCTSACVNDTKTVLQNASEQCRGIVSLDNNQDFKNALQAIQMVCVRDSQTFCWSRVASMVAFDPEAATTQKLELLCDNCLDKMVRVGLSNPDGPFSQAIQALSPYCDKKGNDYCAIRFAQAKQEFNKFATLDSTVVEGALDTVCDPCVSSFLQKLKRVYKTNHLTQKMSQIEPIIKYMNIACNKRSDGEFCLPAVYSRMSVVPRCPNPTSMESDAVCSTQCIADLTELSHSLGCCFGTMVDFMSFDEKRGGAIREFISNTCKVRNVRDCSSKMVKVRLALDNLRWSYVTNNMDDVKEAIVLDLSAATGVSTNKITIEEVVQGTSTLSTPFMLMSTSKVSITANIVPPSSEAADPLMQSIQTQLQSNRLALDSVTQLGLDSRIDPTLDIVADSQASSILSQDNPDGPSAQTSSAGRDIPSILMMSLLLIGTMWVM